MRLSPSGVYKKNLYDGEMFSARYLRQTAGTFVYSGEVRVSGHMLHL
ncbi:hypothetical protein KOXY103107_13260 [Komagataeibacter xylinus]